MTAELMAPIFYRPVKHPQVLTHRGLLDSPHDLGRGAVDQFGRDWPRRSVLDKYGIIAEQHVTMREEIALRSRSLGHKAVTQRLKALDRYDTQPDIPYGALGLVFGVCRPEVAVGKKFMRCVGELNRVCVAVQALGANVKRQEFVSLILKNDPVVTILQRVVGSVAKEVGALFNHAPS